MGAVGYGIGLGVLTLALPWLPRTLAVGLAWLAAVTWTWLGNRRITYGLDTPPSWRCWRRWLVGQAVGGAVGSSAIYLLLNVLPPAAAAAVGTLAGAGINYLAGWVTTSR